MRRRLHYVAAIGVSVVIGGAVIGGPLGFADEAPSASPASPEVIALPDEFLTQWAKGEPDDPIVTGSATLLQTTPGGDLVTYRTTSGRTCVLFDWYSENCEVRAGEAQGLFVNQDLFWSGPTHTSAIWGLAPQGQTVRIVFFDGTREDLNSVNGSYALIDDPDRLGQAAVAQFIDEAGAVVAERHFFPEPVSDPARNPAAAEVKLG